MKELLGEKLYTTVKSIKANEVGVAFSGGVDSTALVKVCNDLGKKVFPITICFSNTRDLIVASKASKALGVNLFHNVVQLEELEIDLKTVLSILEIDRIVRLENGVCFYHVFKLAQQKGLKTVLSANGIDELFCGYYLYHQHYRDEDSILKLMRRLVEIAKKDKKEMDKLSAQFGIDYLCPFLSNQFVDFAINIPSNFKITSSEDNLRKQIFREVACEIGVPIFSALKAKKSLQYSSGIHKAIEKLAKRNGFNKAKAKESGFYGVIEFYIHSLKKSL